MNLDQQLHDTALDTYSKRGDEITRQSQNGFDDLGIATNLRRAIERLKFENPTPVQKEAIPVGIAGNDIIAIAQTGSGKTIAYGVPMLQRLSESKRGTGLVLVPTRELAIQVEESIRTISRSSGIRSVVLIGGVAMSSQRDTLKKNPRIIIATPGRLIDHMERKTVNFANVEIFVLDEADRMLDMGFVPDIKKVMKAIPDDHQTMLFSATMPKEIEAMAATLMEAPTRIEIDRSGATPAEVSHEMFIIKNQDKSRLLAHQLEQCSGPVLVFTKTKWMARKLTTRVNKMGFATAEIHSNRTQGQRRDALDGFRRGKYQILIATDIAARGIDVRGIELVVNYDMPANSEDYVHRIGRTGRAGQTGHAVSYATHEQQGSIKSIERFMKTKLAISALPTLPSKNFIAREADRLSSSNESAREEKPAQRKSSRSSSSKRWDGKKGGSKKFTSRRTESKRKDFKKNDSDRPDSKRKGSKLQKSQPSEVGKKNTKKESPYWANFKKHRPVRKKSVGQGPGRKKRSKRK